MFDKNNKGNKKKSLDVNKLAKKKTNKKSPVKNGVAKKKAVNKADDNVSKRYPNGRTLKTQETKKPSNNNETARKKTVNKARTADGKVPQGRTLKTHDNYLSGGKKTGSTKERPVVVIEANTCNDLAVVPLSSSKGRNRTQLKNYQQGQSYFKHYVEIQDDEGEPIRVNKKFKENHPNMDVSSIDVEFIKDKVFNKSIPKQANQKKIQKFRGNKKNPQD